MDISISTRAKAAPDRVWQVLADLERWPEWLPTVESLEPEEPGREHGVGAAYRLRQPRLPKARWVVTDWTPGHGFTWEADSPGMRSVARHELSEHPDSGTQITLGFSWSGPLAWVARAAYGRLARRYVETEARALAERSEAAHPQA